MNPPTPLDLPTLTARFAIPGRLRFMEIAPGLPVIDIATPLATARVALQGAQVPAPSRHAPTVSFINRQAQAKSASSSRRVAVAS